MKEAMFYEKRDGHVICHLCPKFCRIQEGQYGKCHVRLNQGGVLYTINYGKITAQAYDPIEKKPLYHFYPGTEIFSVASFGCNMSCKFCQNYRLSQYAYNLDVTTPEELVDMVTGLGIAFTYNEPTIWFEYVYEVARLLKSVKPDKKVVLVTNGYINPEPLKMLLPYVDAFNVDLKSYSNHFYKMVCGAGLNPVLEAIKLMTEKHVEVTTLMVTNHITLDDVELVAKFIGQFEHVPLHLSRYYPAYQFTEPPTSVKLMQEAYNIAKKHVDHVYLGNVPDMNNNTECAYCGALLVRRLGFHSEVIFHDARCPACGREHGVLRG